MDPFELRIKELEDDFVTVAWEPVSRTSGGDISYRVLWADRYTPFMRYKRVGETKDTEYTLRRATHIPHYLRVEAYRDGGEKVGESALLRTPVKKVFHEQLEQLDRGLIAVKTAQGVFLSWRMWLDEVTGYTETGMSGTDYLVYRNGEKLALVADSTNYLDRDGTAEDRYAVAACRTGGEAPGTASRAGGEAPDAASHAGGEAPDAACPVQEPCPEVRPWAGDGPYLEVPLRRPEDGVTPAGEAYTYSANDMSVGDADGDGAYELFVKWDPSNSHDVSQKGYTGKCYIDCYKMDGRLLWRLDMGVNIRAGAHYTQFMVYDFDGDGKAELSVKTAPGTCMIFYGPDGKERERRFITLPKSDIEKGVTHADDYVCSAQDYYDHLVKRFMNWREHPMVKSGRWPSSAEVCLGMEPCYSYPLCEADAAALTDYFLDEYAPSRSPKNRLREFEGFIFEGPEYLTMFAGDGRELETIPFPHPREDDGLLWGDYAMPRIEPCNRVDRFLSGVAYLDGERPYLIVCRGYYTRSTVAAYDFFEGRHRLKFDVDSGYVPMDNPFCASPHEGQGTSPAYGTLAGQGNHSLSTADVDGDGCQEIIYGAAVIDHDGTLLYSSYGNLPDGRRAKFGHGDSMHVAVIDPDRPGYQIFNVFEGAKNAPYGWALRDAETGEALFGEYAEEDLGRCMIGDVSPGVRGLSVWVNEMYDARGNRLPDRVLATNQGIRWAADLTTQVLDLADYVHGPHTGIINDNTHGVMLRPEGVLCNNGTKGNPCLVADLFGDFREEMVLRTADSSAVRIYTNTELTSHKLFTLMHDVMYRTGIAWQNNCYNQTCYTKFYYASDMDFSQVLPGLERADDGERKPAPEEGTCAV